MAADLSSPPKIHKRNTLILLMFLLILIGLAIAYHRLPQPYRAVLQLVVYGCFAATVLVEVWSCYRAARAEQVRAALVSIGLWLVLSMVPVLLGLEDQLKSKNLDSIISLQNWAVIFGFSTAVGLIRSLLGKPVPADPDLGVAIEKQPPRELRGLQKLPIGRFVLLVAGSSFLLTAIFFIVLCVVVYSNMKK